MEKTRTHVGMAAPTLEQWLEIALAIARNQDEVA